MKLLKLFVLLILFAGIWTMGSSAAPREDCWTEFTQCEGQADVDFDTCWAGAGGHAALESLCYTNRDNDRANCEATYLPCP